MTTLIHLTACDGKSIAVKNVMAIVKLREQIISLMCPFHADSDVASAAV
jgi:hypothetical protein